MGRVYLIGEEHSLPNKGKFLTEILESVSDQIEGISFELTADTQQQLNNYDLPGYEEVVNFAKNRNIPLLASDKRDFDVEIQRLELKKSLELLEKSDDQMFDAYRYLHDQSIKLRSAYTAQILDNYLFERKGTVVHICGIAHLSWLKIELNKRGYEVKAFSLRNNPEIEIEKSNILDTLSDYILVPMNSNSKSHLEEQIAERWPESVEEFKNLHSEYFKPGNFIIDDKNLPKLLYLSLPENNLTDEFIDASLTRIIGLFNTQLVESCALPYCKIPLKGKVKEKISNSMTKFTLYESHQD